LGTYAELRERLGGQDPIEWAKAYIAQLNEKEKEDHAKVMVQLSLIGLDFTKGSRSVVTTHSRRVYTTYDRPVFTIFHLGEKYYEKISSKERMGEEQTKWSGYI